MFVRSALLVYPGFHLCVIVPGLGNAFLSNIIACDGIYHVVRAFDNDEVLHVDDSVDPVRDLDTINSELCAKDLQFVRAALQKEADDVKKGRSKGAHPMERAGRRLLGTSR